MTEDPRQTELAPALGKLIIRFTDLEYWMDTAIGLLLGLSSEAGEALTSTIISLSARLHILTGLVERLEMTDAQRENLRDAIERIEKLNGDRNWLMHGPWHEVSSGGNKAEPTYLKSRMRNPNVGGVKRQREFTVSEIEKVTSDCLAVRQQLVRFCGARHAEMRGEDAGKPVRIQVTGTAAGDA